MASPSCIMVSFFLDFFDKTNKTTKILICPYCPCQEFTAGEKAMPDYVSIFCAHIKRIHEERGITKQELAALGGVSGSVITDLMQGKGNPTLKTMEGLSIGLSIPLPLLLKPLDSDEWRTILNAAQYQKHECPTPNIPQGYDILDHVVLPLPKIEVIREWLNAPKRGRPRKK